MNRFTRLAFACISVLGVAQVSLAQSTPSPVRIQIDAGKKASFSIPRTIFGSFLEPIGNSTYNGLWAEVLQNPSFENGLWSAPHVAEMIRSEPSLVRASELALPLPWEALDFALGNRYEPRRGDAANSQQSLAILGLPGHETGIKQKIFLPTHRELAYNGSIFVKHLSGPDEIDISIRRRNQPEQVLATAELRAIATGWQKYEFNLRLQPQQLRPLEPADFVIAVKNDERALVDEVSLMPADALDGLDPEMVAFAKGMNTPLVRFGGNFTSAYHWRDGIGPRDKRVSMLNVAWGIPEYNQFGTDEFLHFCELIGAQPQIALNLGSGTPREAAEWVRYIDEHWSKHSGLLWELGNELWGNWNLGYPSLEELPGRTVEFSRAIRAVDPSARLIATGQDPDVYPKWNAAQLADPPDTFQFLSTHFVVTTDKLKTRNASADTIAEDSFALPVELGRRLRAMQAQIDASSNFRDKAHIAFTEWLLVCCDGRAAANAPRYDNMGGALAAGAFFNMFMRNADVVPISDMTGIVEFAGIWKKRGRVFVTPAYHAFRIYSTAHADVPVAVETSAGHYDVERGVTRLPNISDVPYLDVIAALNEAGDELTLFCVNRRLHQDIPAAITVDGFKPAREAKVESLSASSIYDVNDEDRPNAIGPAESTATITGSKLEYTFPRESITRIELSGQ
jgi:alpha-N-arabinofuranosidase